VVLTTNRGEQADQRQEREATPTRLTIGADELHVWRASLERPAPVVASLRRRLASDEHQRADRFRFERDRSRYIVGRGLLRTLLGRYLALKPEAIRFEYGAFEKPQLRDPGPWFNLSHSGPVALYAITHIGEVGIDVELDDEDFAQERIAERFFSPAETAVLRSLPQRLQARAFLTCWTRKEAFIKARGDGLSLPLDSFDVALEPSARAAILRTAWSQDEPQQWSVRDLSDRRAGYVAAVAIRGQVRRIVSRELI
jgi:4'-phosphopantetheinyl transferase